MIENPLENIKVVILAGGLGSRLSELTNKIPKPMVKIGGKPMIAHIINLYVKYGFKNFIIAGGYKYKVIQKFFKNYKKNKIKIDVVNTGLNSLTATRILKLKKYLNKKTFMITYGDGLCSVNLKKLLKYHLQNKKTLTLTAVHPPARFGELELKKNVVKRFNEKPQLQKGWINGGFFVAEPNIFKFLSKKNQMIEREPIAKIVKAKKLIAYKHKYFWYCVDNLRDKIVLENLYKKNKKIW
jgi:glucose-1-phosphate cytidylyltransferase|tara:strand:- start:244 stop:963 length:720 start_codon:yes stop_codon:yes gene_type:complete